MRQGSVFSLNNCQAFGKSLIRSIVDRTSSRNSAPRPWTLGFVKPDSVPKLNTCDFKESNCHRSSNSLKTTSAGTAFI